MPEEQEPQSKYNVKASGRGIVIGDFANVVQNFVQDPKLRPIVILVGVLLAVVVVGTGWFLYSALRDRPPERMSGGYNIAVASFAQPPDISSKTLGEDLANAVKLQLETKIQESNPEIVFQVWGPADLADIGMDAIDGATSEERAGQAEELAGVIGANLIIYGHLESGPGGQALNPEFFLPVAETYYPYEYEIVGQHELGEPISLGTSEQFGRLEANRQIHIRSQVLAHLSLGLYYLKESQIEQALDFFHMAEKVQGWEDDQGKQVLYLLIGNAAGAMEDLDAAQAAFEQALDLDPAYARALIGLGSVAYLRALGPPGSVNVDAGLLDESIHYHELALQAAHQPQLADIPVLVDFGLGQAHMAMAISGQGEGYDLPRMYFQAVIDEFEKNGNQRVTERAGEAYARLAGIAVIQRDFAQAAEMYARAAEILEPVNPNSAGYYAGRAEENRSAAAPE